MEEIDPVLDVVLDEHPLGLPSGIPDRSDLMIQPPAPDDATGRSRGGWLCSEKGQRTHPSRNSTVSSFPASGPILVNAAKLFEQAMNGVHLQRARDGDAALADDGGGIEMPPPVRSLRVGM